MRRSIQMQAQSANQINRRSFLKIAGVTAGAALASGCATAAVDTKPQTDNTQDKQMSGMADAAIPTSYATASIKAKPFQVYDATLPKIDSNTVKQVAWESSDVVQYIAKDIAFQAWTFGG